MASDANTPAQNPDAPLGTDAGVGGAIAHDAGDSGSGDQGSGERTQDAPLLDQNDASEDDRIAGIVAQTRQDVGGESQERIADVLRQRFQDTNISVADDRLAALAAEVASR